MLVVWVRAKSISRRAKSALFHTHTTQTEGDEQQRDELGVRGYVPVPVEVGSTLLSGFDAANPPPPNPPAAFASHFRRTAGTRKRSRQAHTSACSMSCLCELEPGVGRSCSRDTAAPPPPSLPSCRV